MAELPQLKTEKAKPASIACDALIVGAFSEEDGFRLDPTGAEVDGRLDGRLSAHLEASSFKGKPGEIAIAPTFGKVPADTIAVIGLGRRGETTSADARRAAGLAARRLGQREQVVCALQAGEGDGTQATAEGLLLGSYRFSHYKTDPPKTKNRNFILPGADQASLERAAIIAEATALARDLVNEPASTLTPDLLARRAVEVASSGGMGSEVWDEKRLEKEGFGGVLGVASGSERPPRFIQLHYKHKGAKNKVALVGKGITYDSGGLSLKDASSMETMKTDMAGAAAVISAMAAIARLKPKIEVIAFVPTTENMPSGRAIKPGDVITHRGGRTTEVLNTDAEGRLVLADALAFASEQMPDAIVDVATLTGSIMVALGKKATGLFSNDDALTDELKHASETAGERVWPMPLYKEYRKELDSEIADMKNIATRWGGAIFAALFLNEFVGDGIAWAHLDIAGTARADGDYEEMPKGGTGAATRTLIAWVEARAT
ncbi:MAG: leucyl aminopeptidase [Actinomycetota bacterium]|nr:leucyl aminopeptidase [Actinomycetota bacterium]